MIGYILKTSKELNMPVSIVYQKGADITQRNIKVLEVGDKSIKAFCYLRNQKRIFKTENILSASLDFHYLEKEAR